MRARGLKHVFVEWQTCLNESRPMRARGLKLVVCCSLFSAGASRPTSWENVAPHAGAWVETRRGQTLPHRNAVAPHAGAWVETSILPR